MPRIAVDLHDTTQRQKLGAVWRRAVGFVPGESNHGLVAEMEGSPARLAEYDDSGWEICDNVRQAISKGFTFGWWRIAFDVPESLDGQAIAGSTIVFESNIDDYGEIWVDGQLDMVNGVIRGWNVQQRVTVSPSDVPGTRHVVACLAANGPLGKPMGGVFMRYATLAFESRG